MALAGAQPVLFVMTADLWDGGASCAAGPRVTNSFAAGPRSPKGDGTGCTDRRDHLAGAIYPMVSA